MLKRFTCSICILLILIGLISPVSTIALENEHDSCVLAHPDISLSNEIQHYIYELGWEYDINPILVMAIIQKESKCDPDAIGDSGKSIGLMQIQQQWHTARMKKLKCTDLRDPYENITVGMNYLAELFEGDQSTEWVLMAYNGGRTWANKHASIGYTTKYAREVIEIMDGFYEDIESEYEGEIIYEK